MTNKNFIYALEEVQNKLLKFLFARGKNPMQILNHIYSVVILEFHFISLEVARTKNDFLLILKLQNKHNNSSPLNNLFNFHVPYNESLEPK